MLGFRLSDPIALKGNLSRKLLNNIILCSLFFKFSDIVVKLKNRLFMRSGKINFARFNATGDLLKEQNFVERDRKIPFVLIHCVLFFFGQKLLRSIFFQISVFGLKILQSLKQILIDRLFIHLQKLIISAVRLCRVRDFCSRTL